MRPKTTALLHLSDLHVGTEQPVLVAALRRSCAREQPAIVVASGDITQRARPHQFDAALALLQGLGGVALLAVPGNHDIPLFDLRARLFDPYGRWRRVFGEWLEPRLAGDVFAVAGINTTRAWRHKHGELSPQQVIEVSRWLQKQPRQLVRVLVTHHPVVATTAADRVNVVRGAEAALRAWSASGADLVLSGHIHLPFVVPLHERIAGLPRPLWAVNAGTAVSRHVRAGAPPSFNLLRADGRPGRALTLERWDFDVAAAEFAVARVQELVLDRP